MTDEEARFVEDMGIILEADGRPRIAGLILGWLLICDPPHQSFNSLVAALGVSKGSVSSMTRLLMEAGMIERYAVRGDRQTFYRLAPDAWVRALQRQVHAMEQVTAAAERGLALVEGRGSDSDHWRLREMRDLNQIAARQMPTLIEAFERSRRPG
jgi:DNA-binding transcriptional regulator GbsR (MarR family)